MFSIGVWTLNDRLFMERLLGTNLYVASAAILIVTGSIVSIISFLGTFGAYREVRCMLLTYFVILVILFIVMITAGILGYVFRLEVDDRMQQEMHSTIKLYGNDSQVTAAWDAVQTHVSMSLCAHCVPLYATQTTNYVRRNSSTAAASPFVRRAAMSCGNARIQISEPRADRVCPRVVVGVAKTTPSKRLVRANSRDARTHSTK